MWKGRTSGMEFPEGWGGGGLKEKYSVGGV